MNRSLLERLRCASCDHFPLSATSFGDAKSVTILDGVVWCPACGRWYPIEDGLLEFLPASLAYAEDRARFAGRYRSQLETMGFPADSGASPDPSVAEQRKQQEHFDWYAENGGQSYDAFERLVFWQAVDSHLFERWRQDIEPDTWLLDVGCAQGRSVSKVMGLPVNVVGFDISKALVRQALARFCHGNYAATADFFVGDASSLPFRSESFRYVILYGVLHHLQNPADVCREVARILTPGGVYFGCENNRTWARAIFDRLQKVYPLWHEESGAEPLISASDLDRWFSATGVRLRTYTQVFVPPHVVNWLGPSLGAALLRVSDRLCGLLPVVRRHGGLIMIRGLRSS